MTKTSVIEMPDTSRRSLVTMLGMGAALAAGGASLSACSTVPGQNVLPGVIDAINKAIAGVCQIVPVVATIVDIVVTVFPQAAGVATITDQIAQEIAQFVCGLISKAGYHEGQPHAVGPYKANLTKDKAIDLHFFAVSGGKMVLV